MDKDIMPICLLKGRWVEIFLDFLEDRAVKEFTKIALGQIDDKFWTAASSSSGKYHPPENNGIGGLVRHTYKALVIARHLCRLFEISDWRRDCIFAAAILHDTYKSGDVWGEHTDTKHGWIAFQRYKFLDAEISYSKRDLICSCIRLHMAEWSDPVAEKELAKRPTTEERIVQIADYLASRKDISFFPGIALQDYLEYKEKKNESREAVG